MVKKEEIFDKDQVLSKPIIFLIEFSMSISDGAERIGWMEIWGFFDIFLFNPNI
jgi:hypothetical protein